MKILILSTILLSLISCSSIPVSKDRYPASLNQEKDIAIGLRGIPEIDPTLIDVWTSGLIIGAEKNKLNSESVKRIQEGYYYAQSIDEFYNKILILDLHHRYPSFDFYRDLAEQLIAVRRELRPRGMEQEHFLRQALILLDLLADEVLYVGHLLFPNTKQLSYRYPNNTMPCQGRFSLLGDIQVCQGDVILSRDESLSNNFISRLPNYPGNYSLASLTYVQSENKNIQIIESKISKGISRKEMQQKNRFTDLSKSTILRSRSSITTAQAIAGLDQFLKRIETAPEITYDYIQDGADESSFSSAELVQYSYLLGGANQTNPYPAELWNSITQKNKTFFTSQFLPVNHIFPTPSDIELNPRYQAISTSYNLVQLPSERMKMMMTDSLIEMANESDSLLQKLARKLSSINGLQTSQDRQELLLKIDMALETELTKENIYVGKEQLFAQVVFFMLLDQYIGPKVLAYTRRFANEQEAQNQFTSLKKLKSFSRLAIDGVMEELIQELDSVL